MHGQPGRTQSIWAEVVTAAAIVPSAPGATGRPAVRGLRIAATRPTTPRARMGRLRAAPCSTVRAPQRGSGDGSGDGWGGGVLLSEDTAIKIDGSDPPLVFMSSTATAAAVAAAAPTATATPTPTVATTATAQ